MIVRRRGNVNLRHRKAGKKHENRPNAHIINPKIYESKYINIHNILYYNIYLASKSCKKKWRAGRL